MIFNMGALLTAAALLAGALGLSVPASAQATRTWVSGVGDDANPCSRIAPCRTFAEAHTKTAAGGEINCLDAGEFGMFVITKSIAVVCDTAPGRITVGDNDEGYYSAITIEASATDAIFLSGLHVQGNLTAGQGGVLMTSGGALHVRNSAFYALGDCGIAARNATSVIVNHVTASNNFCGVGLIGTTAGQLRFVLSDMVIDNAARSGIFVRTTSPAASISGVVEDSVIVRTSSPTQFDFVQHGISVDASVGQVRLAVSNSVMSNHVVAAIAARGSGAAVTVDDSLIAHNALGVSAQNGASLTSFGGNVMAGNAANGSFTDSNVKK